MGARIQMYSGVHRVYKISNSLLTIPLHLVAWFPPEVVGDKTLKLQQKSDGMREEYWFNPSRAKNGLKLFILDWSEKPWGK